MIEVDRAKVVEILTNNEECRKDNRKLIKEYYKQVYDMTLDEAFTNNFVPNYQTIERYGRIAKAKHKKLRVDKSDKVAEYKEMAREVLDGKQANVHDEDS